MIYKVNTGEKKDEMNWEMKAEDKKGSMTRYN